LAFLPWLNFVRSFRAGLYSFEHLRWIPDPRIADVVGIFSRELVWGNAPLRSPWSLIFRVLSIGSAIVVVWLIARNLAPSARSADHALRKARWRHIAFPAWLLVGPVILAVVISRLYHPVYYAPRFSILVLAPFLVILGQAFEQLHRPFSRRLAVLSIGLLMASATIVQTTVVSRRGMFDFAALWASSGPPTAAVFFPSFKAKEASHYVGTKIRSARRAQIEEIAASGMPSVIWVCVHRGAGWRPRAADDEYRAWLLGLGPVKKVATVDNLDVVSVSIAMGETSSPQVSPE
jgi:hypothetical protein